LKDRVRNIVEVTRQITNRDSDNFDTVRFEPSVALQVALRPIAHVVAYAIEFDR
jgi:hypothetical protein